MRGSPTGSRAGARSSPAGAGKLWLAGVTAVASTLVIARNRSRSERGFAPQNAKNAATTALAKKPAANKAGAENHIRPLLGSSSPLGGSNGSRKMGCRPGSKPPSATRLAKGASDRSSVRRASTDKGFGCSDAISPLVLQLDAFDSTVFAHHSEPAGVRAGRGASPLKIFLAATSPKSRRNARSIISHCSPAAARPPKSR